MSGHYLTIALSIRELQVIINGQSVNRMNLLFYIIFTLQSKKKAFFMGQEQLSRLKQQIKQGPNIDNLSNQTSFDFLKNIIEHAEKTAKEPLTPQLIQHHLKTYLQSLGSPTRKRSRSYELIKVEELSIEDKCESNTKEQQCKILQEQMVWLEQMQEEIRYNITQIMSTQKIFKIRQNFRKLILKLLKLDNLIIEIIHQNGRIEYHDFKNNYITDVLEVGRLKKLNNLIISSQSKEVTHQIMDLFDLNEEEKEQIDLYQWTCFGLNDKYKVFLTWKNHQVPIRATIFSKKMIQKIANICMISTLQEENTVIQNYSKDLLDIYQIYISQSESKTCAKIESQFNNFHQVEEQILQNEAQEENKILLSRIRAFQQLEYQLLERIRMYKKYVCQLDKIFLDFDEKAQLIFLTNNFNHKILSQFGKLYENNKLFIQNIFKQNKSINDFLKKALQKKVKHNKLYELDFETKARVKYGQDGRIIRLHVIIQQLQNSSSHSSSNLYCSSSTKILSDQSDKKSENEILNQDQREVRQSVLIKNLQKQNPGIINQGWINLFIKQHHMGRINTHLKHKGGKSYTVKRSYSLNRQLSSKEDQKEDSQLNEKLLKINTESIDLNLLQVDDELLEPLVLRVLKKLEYFNQDNINLNYFENFLSDLHNGYQLHNNPFHNFTHGVNVMHTCYLLSSTSKVKQILNPFKMFTVVFSGLCHDVGHTGFTNLFEIASHSKKAITYNDSSPLQNYHASYTFELLRKPQNNFLKCLTYEEMKQFRKSVISNILYTDIKEHFPLLKKFNAVLKDQIPKNDEYVTLLSAMIVHTSDFGGSAKEFQICKQWSLKVNLEFSNQYKMQGELGLPQTPFMKDLTNIQILSKNEGGFLKVIVLPLYEAIDEFNGTDYNMRRLRQYVENNMKQWQKIHIQSIQQKKESEAE